MKLTPIFRKMFELACSEQGLDPKDPNSKTVIAAQVGAERENFARNIRVGARRGSIHKLEKWADALELELLVDVHPQGCGPDAPDGRLYVGQQLDNGAWLVVEVGFTTVIAVDLHTYRTWRWSVGSHIRGIASVYRSESRWLATTSRRMSPPRRIERHLRANQPAYRPLPTRRGARK